MARTGTKRTATDEFGLTKSQIPRQKRVVLQWSNYVRGVAAALLKRGIKLKGGDLFITTLSLWTSMPFPGQQRSLKASMTSLLSQSPRAGKRGGARRSGLRRVESSGPNFAAEELPPCWSMRSVATDSSATW